MGDRLDVLTAKVDGLDTRVTELSASIDKRFEAEVETRLSAEMKAGFSRLDRTLDQLIDATAGRA